VPPTGKAFDLNGTDVWTIADDGRATSVRAYYDSATLARQLGLA
jgi:ketosteroid isomerase-like protein